MARYFFYPALSEQSDLNQLLARLAWFFSKESLDEAIFFTDPTAEAISLERFKCPPELNPVIAGRVKKIKDRVKIRRAVPANLDSPYDAVFLWQEDPETLNSLKKLTGKNRIWRVDRENTRMEGSFWIEALHALDSDRASVREQARERLALCRDENKGTVRASVIASGPSAATYEQFDFSEDLVIICNSVIADAEMVMRLKPRILCFADPLFHFGPSRYTEEFYKRVREAVREYNPWVIIPWKYRRLLLDHVPEIEPRLIALPMSRAERFNFNLLGEPEPKVTDNILTYLLIPIAATFCEQIRLLGCDGRPISENKYFWSFNPRTQFSPELMQNIQTAHPGFFKIDYNDYYTNHCKNLERQILQLEKCGHTIESLTPSHIPVLQRRSPPPTLRAIKDLHTDSKESLLISLNPHLKNHFGHFLHFDAALQAAFSKKGYRFISLSGRNLDLNEEPEWPVLPFFSQTLSPSNKVSPHNLAYEEWAKGFRREIKGLIDVLSKDPTKEFFIFLYMANARIVQEILSAVTSKSADNISWILSLTGIYVEGWPSANRLDDERWKLMQYCADHQKSLSENFRISLIADSHSLAKALKGEKQLPALPMFQMTPFKVFEDPRLEEQSELSVVYPTNAQQQKGFDLLPEALSLVLKDYKNAVRFRIRTYIPIEREKADLDKVRLRLPECVEQIPGVMDNESYQELILSSDVILIPYRANSFSLRTSGQLVDAILLGKPVVATRETWAGEIVEQLGFGATFSDGDIGEFAQALKQVIADFETTKRRAEAAKNEWISANNSELFADKLLEVLPGCLLKDTTPTTKSEIAKAFELRFYGHGPRSNEIGEKQRDLANGESSASKKVGSAENARQRNPKESKADHEQMIYNRDRAILEQKEKYAKEYTKVLNRDKAITNLKNKILLRERDMKQLQEEVRRLRRELRKRL